MARPPLVLVVPAVVGLLFFALPLAGLIARAPWSDLGDQLGAPSVRSALRLSLVTSLSAAVIAVLLGVPLAWVLARVDFRGRTIVRGLCLLPLVLPPVVAGVALSTAFGRAGIAGGAIGWAGGATLFGSAVAVVLAQAFVAMPFLVITVEGGLRAADTRFEAAAATLGSGWWTTFRRVTLPSVLPSVVAGIVLAWARALGEFGATIAFAGNVPGATQTMPLAVYLKLQTDVGGAVVLSLVLVAVSLAVLVALRAQWWPRP